MATIERGFLTIKLLDYSNEGNSHTVFFDPLLADDLSANAALITAYRTAVDNLTLGSRVSVKAGSEVFEDPQLPAVNPFAQIEMVWEVSIRDNVTGSVNTMTIGTADLTGSVLVAGTDDADLTDAKWIAYANAFNAFGRSPKGNPATFIGAKFAGRRR